VAGSAATIVAPTSAATRPNQNQPEGLPDVRDGTHGKIPLDGPVAFRSPRGGWTWQAYHCAVRAFTRARGQAPRTVTIHPQALERLTQTKHHPASGQAPEAISASEAPLEALGCEEHVVPAEHDGVRIVTSSGLAPETLVLA
jgi:hypothetical protein